jgi:hypothetical protein
MELCKVSSVSYTIETRFDLVPQPVIVDAALPEYTHLWHRPDKEEIDDLGNVVDHLAVDIIKSSLEGDLVVGEEVSFVQRGSVQIINSDANGSCITDPQTAISCICKVGCETSATATSISVSYRTVAIEVPCAFRSREEDVSGPQGRVQVVCCTLRYFSRHSQKLIETLVCCASFILGRSHAKFLRLWMVYSDL